MLLAVAITEPAIAFIPEISPDIMFTPAPYKFALANMLCIEETQEEAIEII